MSWSSKRQHTVSRSSAEVVNRVVANVVAEDSCLRQLLSKLQRLLHQDTIVFPDMSMHPVQHQRIKHIDIDLHFVCDRVALRDIRVFHMPSSR